MKITVLKSYELCFLTGLVLYTVGQFLIFVVYNDIDVLHAQKPIDFAHWFMLVGVLLLVPQATGFPKSRLNIVGVPMLILGIGLIIGMCVLDFVFWSIESPEQKSELATHLINSPAIWLPFMTLSGKIFNFGLVVSSLSYYRFSRIGTSLVLAGTMIIYGGGGWLNVVGYVVITAGFCVSFCKLNST